MHLRKKRSHSFLLSILLTSSKRAGILIPLFSADLLSHHCYIRLSFNHLDHDGAQPCRPLQFIALAHAYTTFHTNCTAPSTSVNFVWSNETRGTIDILWSCLFTIIACTWTVQHLNVPEQRGNRDPGRLGDIKWALKRTWTSAKWMLTTALAPELLLSQKLGGLLDPKGDLR